MGALLPPLWPTASAGQIVPTPVRVVAQSISSLAEFRALALADKYWVLGIPQSTDDALETRWRDVDEISLTITAVPEDAISGLTAQLDSATGDARRDVLLDLLFASRLQLGAVQPLVNRAEDQSDGGAIWAGQASVSGLVKGEAGGPAVQVQVLKYYLGLGADFEVPFYILSSLPGVGEADPERLAGEVLGEYGGTMNVALGVVEESRLPDFWGINDWDANSPFGLFGSIRIGGKAVDLNASEPDADTKLAGLGYASASLRLMFPIWDANDARRGPNDRAGSLQVLLTGIAQAGTHRTMKAIQGVPDDIDPVFVNLNGHLSLNITNQLDINASFIWLESSNVSRRSASFSISVARDPN